MEEIKIIKPFKNIQDVRKHFDKINFYELGEYMINVDNFTVINEDSFDEKKRVFTVTIFVKNNVPLVLELPASIWNNFKNSRLL